MRLLVIALILSLVVAAPCHSQIDSMPDTTILLSSFTAITMVDNFAVGVTTRGVAVLQYESDSSMFIFRNQLFLSISQAKVKRFGDTLVVNADNQRLYFLDISNLPALEYLGSVDLGQKFADFTIADGDIYSAQWFDGIRRYHLNSFSSASFADSSMKGILVSQLEVKKDTLYALDEYNGILRYDLNEPGFGRFLDYLYVPFRVSSFVIYGSQICMLLNSGGVSIGEFGQPDGRIVDSIQGIPSMYRAFSTDSLLLLLTERTMYVYSRADLSQKAVVDIQNEKLDGDLFIDGTSEYIVLPGNLGGISLVNLSTYSSYEGLFRPGVIQDMFVYKSHLYTSGSVNPVDLWKIKDSARISYDYSIRPDIQGTSLMAHNGDSLVVLYPDFSKVGVILNASNPDSASLENTFSVGASPIRSLDFVDSRWPNWSVLMVDRPEYLDVYILTDSGYVTYINRWSFIDKIVDYAVKDTFLYVIIAKRVLMAWAIHKDFTLSLVSGIGLYGNSFKTFVNGDQLLIFGVDRIAVINISDPPNMYTDTVVNLPLQVTAMQRYGDSLYAVGPGGISIFDLTTPVPELVAHGGMAGSKIAVGSGIIAVSDGNGIYIYNWDGRSGVAPGGGDEEPLPARFDLAQNYPNPFNPATVIQFELATSEKVRLEVFNILGQRVSTLVDQFVAAGPHRVTFDGSKLASGVYFYRLTARDKSATKKMVLVK